ncbi:S41 family peptidase [Candidatus Nomurabacteria bacterium]|nr:S41 family peptidase [Candidatus Nomurabacteria bacterium]
MLRLAKFYQRFFLFVILVIALGVAFWAGGDWRGRQEELLATQPENIDLAPFWKTWKIIDEKFVDTRGTSTEPTTNQDRVWGAISGLVASLGDPYSDFLPPRDKKVFEQDIRGSFGGLGIEIGVRDGVLSVISPLEGGPGKRAGLKAGDQIIEIDSAPTGKMTVTEATSKIRGEVGTVITLGIGRKGENSLLRIKVVREIIKVPTIETELLPEKIFLIRLFNFGATAPELFRDALRDFIISDTDKMIVDLRGNPGGYLDAAVDLASWFLPVGKPVVIENWGGKKTEQVYRSRGYNIFSDKLKLVILVDGGSASASEILAGALSEYGRAKLIGEQTFGKGSVQELVPITSESALKITVAQWLTPNGVSISHDGLTPDIIVKLDPNKKLKADEDPILDQAVKYLLSP